MLTIFLVWLASLIFFLSLSESNDRTYFISLFLVFLGIGGLCYWLGT
jgi:hypothetical protein